MNWKIIRRVTAIVLTMSLLVACGKEDFINKYNLENKKQTEESGKYPVKWDLESVYASQQDWQTDYDKAMDMLSGYERFKGNLNNAQTIKEYLDFAYFTELTAIQKKLWMYAKLGNGLDATDGVFKNMLAKLDNMDRIEKQKCAFADTEIFELSLEERQEIFSDPVFQGLEYWLRSYVDPDYEPLSEDEKLVASTLSMGYGYAEQIFDILNDVELPYPTIKLPNGKTVELTDEEYYKILGSAVYKDEFKKEANQVYLTRYKNFANTFAALLEENCSQAYAAAVLNNEETTLDDAFADYDLDTGVFDMLVEAAHKGIPEYQRYLDLHAEGLGIKEQYAYNMTEPVSYYYRGRTDYDDAVDEVIDALSVLGDDYIDHFKEIITSGHVDVYPTDNKTSGAYESRLSSDYLPWVLFNYEGYPDDVSTIAHEMGHAVYDLYSSENQIPGYQNPTIFTQEVASTTNELLYYNYMMNKAETDEEKLFYLECAITMYANTFFTQMMYSEFEDYMYKIVESGEALDAEGLSDKWAELVQEYRGDSIVNFEENRYQWASIPHLYYVYYVYQYSADVAYAASIAERITAGEEGAVDEYIEFLKKGNSATPVDLLSGAGIDPLSAKTYDHALEYFTSLVDEYERLIKK
ncbi:M3 family metallopeptidase [Butyrivibrio sp. MC2021]|uniref:M3 family metallopeptidase n=1 Tax=Butyrivibrio sp. MC2021 TaxID=1408306 RepID=UPI00047C5992|nr:M3 family metallopeptidase [Butyrivibrio sp. MC2021]